jgi:biotin carboxylase
MSKPVAIVLGGTFPHITLIKNLQKRGYYTILIDYYEYPAAKSAADEHIQESTLDKEKVLQIASDKEARLVISTCIDQANVTACYVAEQLDLPRPYTYEIALSVSDKRLMKDIMHKNGIPTSKYMEVDCLENIDVSKLKFPLIIKPSDSNSSKGVRRADDKNQLLQFLPQALEISRNKKAIIEEFVTGREIGIDCIIKNGEANIIMTRERRKVSSVGSQIQQIQGSFWPADLTLNQLEQFKNISESIARVFDFDNTPLLIQAILNENGISVIEFAPRIGGGENYKIIELQTGFDIINSAVDSFLQKDITINYIQPTMLMADIYLYTESDNFESVSGFDDLINDKLIEYYNIYKKKGAQIGSDISSNNRVGAFIIKSDSKEDLMEKINVAISRIEIYNLDGKPIMRKDIYGY